MKKYAIYIIVGIISGLIGTYIGHRTAVKSVKNKSIPENDTLKERIDTNDIINNHINNETTFNADFITYEEIRKELIKKEETNYLDFVGIYGEIVQQPEQLFIGSVGNDALWIKIKDVKIMIDLFSDTDKLIKSKPIYVNEYFHPGREVMLREKIDLPPNYSYMKYRIESAVLVD